MAMTRRIFLAASGAALGTALGLPQQAIAAEGPLFASAWLDGDKAGFAILDRDGAILKSLPLPGRGHDVTIDHANGRLVAFARRPGNFAMAIDHANMDAPVAFTSPADRHFYGHGCFSPDGRLLYATENDFDNARGIIGIYDATGGFRRIGEFPSHGIGPHDVLLMPGGKTLCIANGGIETHPDYGRAKLNLDHMEPSIVFLDRETGTLIEKHELPASLSRLSTRHMDIDAKGTVWIGCQYQGEIADNPPLLLRVAPGEEHQTVMLPKAMQTGLAGYIGSVAANREAGTLAVTSPKGNSVIVIDATTGNALSHTALTDVCGVAPDRNGFLLSNGEGHFGTSSHHCIWDNHIAVL